MQAVESFRKFLPHLSVGVEKGPLKAHPGLDVVRRQTHPCVISLYSLGNPLTPRQACAFEIHRIDKCCHNSIPVLPGRGRHDFWKSFGSVDIGVGALKF